MATYKVTNADAPIESDYWIDYPIKDPATNLDSVDEEGHILVERHVTRSVNLASYNSILAKMPAVDANTTGLADLKTYAETNVQALNTALDGANTSITSVTKTATDTATTVSNIQKKIDTIKGIDIDEFKLVTDTNIKNIKENYLPLAGGTVTGDLVLSGKVSSNSSIKADLQGTADRVIGDINGKALTSYIANLEVSGASVTVTNGAGETSNYTVDNINHAINADNATHADSATNAKHATNADHATTADSATNATNATKASQNASGYALTNTIVKSIAISDRTITVTKLDGTSYTLTMQDIASSVTNNLADSFGSTNVGGIRCVQFVRASYDVAAGSTVAGSLLRLPGTWKVMSNLYYLVRGVPGSAPVEEHNTAIAIRIA